MGVPGLWDIINKVGQARSLSHLAVIDGFEGNKSGRRAFRIGIDASIWYHHASFSKGGENPELRMIFFRLRSLAELPLLPLFVFDGRERPKVKRGSKLGKSGSHSLTGDVKRLLDAFGMEWRMAIGEAEAELAHLNQVGVIDAIMTDDCDVLIFGGRTIIKNPGLALSGNKSHPALNAQGKASKHHIMVYTADAVQNHPEVGLTREGMILFALLAGGDYNKGVDRFGPGIAHALARCGFGELLLAGFERRAHQDIHQFLVQWRTSINEELRTNSRGFLRQRYPSLSLPAGFPDQKVLENYAKPANSARERGLGGVGMRDAGELNLAQLAGFCEEKFGDWGYKAAIIKRFRDLLWPAAVIRVLRRAALEADEKEKTKRIEAGIEDWSIRHPLKPSRAEAIGTPTALVKKYLNLEKADHYRSAFVNQGSHSQRTTEVIPDPNPLILKIVGTRKHISTDGILEYRVEVSPEQLIALASSGIKGKRHVPSHNAVAVEDEFDVLMHGEGSQQGPKKLPPDPHSPMRIWIPASIMHQVHPGLVEEFAIVDEVKKNRMVRGKKKGKSSVLDEDDGDSEVGLDNSPAKAALKPKRKLAKQGSNTANANPTQIHSDGPSHSIDPDASWYTPQEANIAGQSDAKRGFLFYFTDPEPLTVLDDDDPLQQNLEEMLLDKLEYDNGPPNRFDLLFDQIMGVSGKTSRARKAAPRRKRPRSSASLDADGPNSIRGGTDKRRKTTHGESSADHIATNPHRSTHKPQPPTSFNSEVLELFSDSEGMPSSHSGPPRGHASSAIHRNTSAVAAAQTRTRQRYYPTLSSSQESGLTSLEDMIDLT